MKRYLLLPLLIGCSAALANPLANNMVACPAAAELSMDGQQHWWATKSYPDPNSNDPRAMRKLKWYSTSPSLAKGIARFAGAQYMGSTEGHVVCLYLPKITFQTLDFPILVYFENLTLRPKGGAWKADPKNSGILNCVSSDPNNCPYLVYQPDAIKDPYESLRELG